MNCLVESLLDKIFSSSVLVTFLPIFSVLLLLIFIIRIIHGKYYRNIRKFIFCFIFCVSLIFIFWLFALYPNRFYYGYVNKFQYCIIHPTGRYIWAFDYMELLSKGTHPRYWRGHCIDIVSGERVFKKSLGLSLRLTALKQDTMWVDQQYAQRFLTRDVKYENKISAYDFFTGNLLLKIDDYVLKTNCDLGTSIDKSNPNYLVLNNDKSLVSVSTINGYYYYLSLKDLTLKAVKTEPLKSSLKTFPVGYSNVFSFEGERRKFLIDIQGKKRFNQHSYIKPSILQVAEEHQRIIILSYTTTTEEQVIIHCVDFKGDIVWSQEFNEPSEFGFSGLYKNCFYISFNNTIYNFRFEDGKLNWKYTY